MDNLKLIEQRQCWRLTWQGRFAFLLLLVIFAALFCRQIPRFLSINEPIHGDVLLLDGQMPDYAIKQAIDLFQQGNYKMIITTGGPLSSGFYLSEMKTMAELTRATFLKLGFDSSKVLVLPTSQVLRNRTLHSAQTLHQWLEANHSEIHAIDVVAIGCHARRSRLLFQRALGDQCKVGIICIDDPSFELHRWWQSSIGARSVVSETIAFTYVKLFH